MIKAILHGACGKMGHMITDIVSKDPEICITAGVDAFGSTYADFPVYKSLDECSEEADVVIDFSNASAVSALFDYCEKKNIPVVVCTTGLSEEQTELMKKTSEKVAVLKSANMSVGINLLQNLLAEAAPKLAAAGFDIEIVEKHHNLKVDAPSGTALMIADGISETLSEEPQYVYDRHAYRKKRSKNEIGIHSVRGGTIVGEHEVIFAGHDEVVTLTHQAQSKEVFAAGAVNAAAFLAQQPAGLYDMTSLLADKFE